MESVLKFHELIQGLKRNFFVLENSENTVLLFPRKTLLNVIILKDEIKALTS